MRAPAARRIVARASAEGFSLDASQLALLEALSSTVRAEAEGLFVHGAPGRGKSWVTNAFFDAVPSRRKTRVHFHGFLAALHRSIHRRRPDPDAVGRAIDDVVGDARLLLFDEFHVHDSGDARLLTLLLERIFARGIVVIATSNYAPRDLLPDPLWHHMFLDGIALITAHMRPFDLDGAVDYRALPAEIRDGFAASTWGPDEPADAPHPDAAAVSVVAGRAFPVRAIRDDALWISFAQLCGTPTATIEYLEWAARHPRWVITDLPVLAEADPQAQQRFIHVIDVLADLEVPTTFVSRHPLEGFLAGTTSRPDAFRMVSRLQRVRS